MGRNTKQGAAVLSVLKASGRALTPSEICELAQTSAPGLNLTTVYRRLKSGLSSGEVVRVELPGQVTRFESSPSSAMSAPEHHHHFHCNTCDRVYPIQGCPGSMKNLAPRGFKVEGHEITLKGRCSSCVSSHAA
jgi:Fur family transcriptional regulator, ferric uptake regulator